MLDFLNKLDTDLFLLINSFHNDFFDVLMVYVSAKFFWIPLYLFLLYLIIKELKWRAVLVLIAVALLVTISDQLSVHLFKNVFERLRPCHNPDLSLIVHTVEKCGGQFGFISSHAANSFALAFFISNLLRQKYSWIGWLMYVWATLVIYSRIYLGVHYPGDVIVGAVFGLLIGWMVLLLYQHTGKLLFESKKE